MTKNKQNIPSSRELKEQSVSLRVRKDIVALVDQEREKYSTPRSSWIIQAMVEKLEKLGYEIK